MLRNIILTAVGALLLCSGWSCNKEENQAPGFDMTYREDFSIPAGIGIDAVHHFIIHNISSNYTQYLSQHGKKDADISGILTAQAVVSGIYGDANFDFVEEATLRIFNDRDPDDYVEIAYRFPVPIAPGNALPLIPNLPDIKRFLQESRFSVDLGLRLRKITPDETTTRLDLQFRAAF